MSKADRTKLFTLPAAQLSRPTSAAMPGGFAVVVKFLLNDELADELRVFSRERGYGSVSDCSREKVMVMLRGEGYLLSLHRDRIESLANKETNKWANNQARKAA